MKAITVVFYTVVVFILGIGVYFYAVSHRYSYQYNGRVRIDNFTGKAQLYDIVDTIQPKSDYQNQTPNTQVTQPSQAPTLHYYQAPPVNLTKQQSQGFRQLILDAFKSAGYDISKKNVDRVYDMYKQNPMGFVRDFWAENKVKLDSQVIKNVNNKYLHLYP